MAHWGGSLLHQFDKFRNKALTQLSFVERETTPTISALVPLFPEAGTPFCVSDGNDNDAFLDDPVNNTKRKPSYRALPMHVIHRRKSLRIGGNGSQRRVNSIQEAYCCLLAPFSIPIKRLVKIAAVTRKIVNG
ncbi:MAG TPA: hypothetical protein VIH42_02410 [Thermoguttaceae bacterium]